MSLYDLTLKKEVAREGAWEILGRINKVEEHNNGLVKWLNT